VTACLDANDAEAVLGVVIGDALDEAGEDFVGSGFRLRIQPLRCVGGSPNSGFWMDLADAQRAAIPTPVRNLLQALTGNRHATRR